MNSRELSIYFNQKKDRENLSLREIAKQTGIHASTLSRISTNRGDKSDAETLLRVGKWLGMTAHEGLSINREAIIYYPDKPMIDAIVDFIEDDPKLEPWAQKGLSELFRVAYNGMANTGKLPVLEEV